MIDSMGKFATCICCIDGRVHLPLIKWIKEKHEVAFVDIITIPGPDKVISKNSEEDLKNVKHALNLSLNVNGSEKIILAGHYDCRANNVSHEEHISLIKKGVEIISTWGISNAEVTGVWVNEKSEVEIV